MYNFCKFLQRILLKVPFWVIHFLGKFIGLIFYWHPRSRRAAFRNIKMVFPEKPYHELSAILKRSFHYLALDVIENLITPRIYPFVTIKGEENITPGGGILVGIHAGNWEIAASLFAHRRTFAVFVKQQRNKELDRFLNEMRVKGKINVVFSIKGLIRYLKDGHSIGIVIDHGAEKEAPVVEFFSHLVPTPRGSVYLAKKFNKKIYPYFCCRKGLFYHVSEIGKPIDASGKSDEEILRSLNKIYEDYLRRYPWEYFWHYKRFKHKINLEVALLTDGKLGHFKQTEAMLNILSEKKQLLHNRTVAVTYRSQFHRFLADIFATCISRHNLFSGKLLSWVVTKKTWRALNSVYADLVISTGSIAAPANKLLASYMGAKSAVILRPNVPLRKFDLIILPEHDRIPGPQAVVIKGALCYPQNLEEKVNQCKNTFNLSQSKKICFFLGGPLLDKQEFLLNLKIFISKLKEFSEKNNYKILLSTSRRTPAKAEELIEKEFKDFKQTEASVYANRKNFDFVFEGFIALADITFVSTDSISMVSESMAVNPSTVCVTLGQEDDKHKVFLESIKNEVSFLTSPYDLESIVVRSCQIFAKNKQKISKAIERII